MIDILRSKFNISGMDIFLPSDETLTVSIVVLPGSSIMSLACTVDPLRAANRIAGRQVFDWMVHTFDDNEAVLSSGLALSGSTKFDPSKRRDMLIVIAGFDSDQHATRATLHSLSQAAPRAKCIGGIEAGAWLLARAGLLNNHRATTHWEDLEDFRNSHPRVDVIPDRFVIDGKFFTTGGASPTVDFMLYLLRARCGAGFAMQVASAFIYDEAHAPSDAQSIVSLGHLHGIEPRIAAAVKIMETHIDEPISAVEIAAQINISVRLLENLFQKTLQVSPVKYYRALRLSAARRMAVDTRLSVQEIAIRTGFNSLSAFSRAFQRAYGASPLRLRQASK